MKDKISYIVILVVLIVGLSLLLYPTISDYWNFYHQSRAIATYSESVATLDDGTYDRLLSEAKAFNTQLANSPIEYRLSDSQKKIYDYLLNIDGNGIIGYVEVPSIDCSLPIYHGTDENVLQVAIGHLEWTSLPVGGKSTHCVISGHRGLPSARLFTDINKLTEGDIFTIRVLDETLTYEVDKILIVEPHETEDLKIVNGEDYCTLMTCTPYGVNTHRLLVRGHRIENLAESSEVFVIADATQIEPLVIAIIVAIPLLIILLIYVCYGGKHKAKMTAVYYQNLIKERRCQ